jgi:hypothetical protein
VWRFYGCTSNLRYSQQENVVLKCDSLITHWLLYTGYVCIMTTWRYHCMVWMIGFWWRFYRDCTLFAPSLETLQFITSSFTPNLKGLMLSGRVCAYLQTTAAGIYPRLFWQIFCHGTTNMSPCVVCITAHLVINLCDGNFIGYCILWKARCQSLRIGTGSFTWIYSQIIVILSKERAQLLDTCCYEQQQRRLFLIFRVLAKSF